MSKRLGYFEKHIVINKGEQRVDYESAINIEDFHFMIKQIKELQDILDQYPVTTLINAGNSSESVILSVIIWPKQPIYQPFRFDNINSSQDSTLP